MSGIMQSAISNWRPAVASGPTLVYDLDAATYTSLSANFNGSTQYLDIASTTAFGFGTADFTIECWWRPTVNQRSDVLDFFSTPGSNPTTRFDFGRITSTTLDLYTDSTPGGSGAKITGPTIASLLNAWHHIAITRQSGSIKMWVDGTQAGSTYSANVLDMGTGGMAVRIMGDHGASGNGSGNLSNIRVVRDVAVYTGTFTVPTSPLALTQNAGTNISAITAGQTQLLLPLTTVPFTDSSTNALSVTNTGTVVPGVQYPFTATDSTGTYTITVANAGSSITYSSTNGGIFSKITNSGTDVMYGGPNWVTGQSYSVFMAYQRTATSDGRLLNTQSEASADWLMGLYNGNPNTFYPNGAVNLPATGADLVWHFGWATLDISTGVGQLYTATNTQPTGTSFSVTNAGFRGFNQLRMFSRSAGSEVQTGNIGFVKVYNGVLPLATVQSLYTTYAARFGY